MWPQRNSPLTILPGDPDDIQVTGLSAGKISCVHNASSPILSLSMPGAHSVHQILHHASRLPAGVVAPFASAMLQSNSIACVLQSPYCPTIGFCLTVDTPPEHLPRPQKNFALNLRHCAADLGLTLRTMILWLS